MPVLSLGHSVGVGKHHLAGRKLTLLDRILKVVDRAERRPSRERKILRLCAGANYKRRVVAGVYVNEHARREVEDSGEHRHEHHVGATRAKFLARG